MWQNIRKWGPEVSNNRTWKERSWIERWIPTGALSYLHKATRSRIMRMSNSLKVFLRGFAGFLTTSLRHRSSNTDASPGYNSNLSVEARRLYKSKHDRSELTCYTKSSAALSWIHPSHSLRKHRIFFSVEPTIRIYSMIILISY